jgi:radical SAM superfamily enzyme YgiQ (UPF0313 family)
MPEGHICPAKLVLVGQSPNLPYGVKPLAYASFALMAFLRQYLPEDLREFYSVEVLDFSHDDEPMTMASAINAREPQIVGFSAYIWNSISLISVARLVKSARPQALVVIGGPQISSLAWEVAKGNYFLDVVVFAPINGELIILSIVEAMMRKHSLSLVPGIVFRNEARELVRSTLPVPDLDFLRTPSAYALREEIFAQEKDYMGVIETSRGCPFGCGFCFWSSERRRIEYFPLARCFADIERVYNNPKVKSVFFADADFLSDPGRTELILQHIRKQERQVSTIFEYNFAHITEATSKLMGSFPGYLFVLAIQTTNPAAISCIGGSRPTPEIFKEKLNLLKAWVPGVKFRVALMLGLPGDSYEGFIGTLDFVLGLEPYYIMLNYPVYLLPGSRFYEQREQLGINYVSEPPFPVIETTSFPKADIERALRFGIWVQILTYYYPAIARLFYDLAKRDGCRVSRLQRWIAEVERQISVMPLNEQITDSGVLCINAWNDRKKAILLGASRVRVAVVLYRTIKVLEEPLLTPEEKHTLGNATAVFDYLMPLHGNQAGYDPETVIPQDLLAFQGPGELCRFFSVLTETGKR